MHEHVLRSVLGPLNPTCPVSCIYGVFSRNRVGTKSTSRKTNANPPADRVIRTSAHNRRQMCSTKPAFVRPTEDAVNFGVVDPE